MTQHYFIAETFPANAPTFDAMVAFDAEQRHTGLPDPDDHGWSAPTWVRFANGDLILGCFPLADTYLEQEAVVETDYARAQANGEARTCTIDARDATVVECS